MFLPHNETKKEDANIVSKGYARDDDKALEYGDCCGGPAVETIPSKAETQSEYILTCSLGFDDLERVGRLLNGAGYKYSIARLLKDVPDTEQPLFRFELFFDGEYQAVGLLQPLDEICGPAVYRRLMKPFKDSLPVPMEINFPCSFWFTEQGLRKFADAIDEINRCISKYGWEARCIMLWVHEMNYLYEDDYQVALGPEFVDHNCFTSFVHADELLEMADNDGPCDAPDPGVDAQPQADA